MIPKTIWQSNLFEKSDMPSQLVMHSQLIKDLNPNFDYRYISDSEMSIMMNDYAEKYDPIIKKFWEDDSVQKFLKSDLWRSICLYENGGIYIDHDVQIIYPLDEDIVDENNVLLSEASYDVSVKKTTIANGAFGVKEKSSLMLSYIYFFIECLKYSYEYDIQKVKIKTFNELNWWWKFYPIAVPSWSVFWNMSLNYFTKDLPGILNNYKIKEYFCIVQFENKSQIKDIRSIIEQNKYPILHGNLFKKNHYEIKNKNNFVSLGEIKSTGIWNFN